MNENRDHISNIHFDSLGRDLVETGFLRYADSLKEDTLKKDVIESFNIYDEDNYKIVHVDAEELSEFSFDFFLPQVNRILLKRGIKLEVQLTSDYETSNEVFINGQKIKLYTSQELESGAFWDSAPRSFFRRVNELLRENNIEEKFYLLYGGNDLHTLLLTENEFNIISERYKDDKNEMPYLP